MTIRSTSGISVSVCQTVTGGLPPIFVSAAIISRSRLRPGRRTTAAFTSANLHLVVLDHRVCEQLFAHRLDVILGLGGVRAFEFDLEHLALPDRSDAGEIKRRKRAFNRLSLWVENAVLQRDGNACLDHG